jgi:hypothetical protein
MHGSRLRSEREESVVGVGRKHRPLDRVQLRRRLSAVFSSAPVCAALLGLAGLWPAAALANTGAETIHIQGYIDATHYSATLTNADPSGTSAVNGITFNTSASALTGASVTEMGWPCKPSGVGDAQACLGSGMQSPGQLLHVVLTVNQQVSSFKVCATTDGFVTVANTTCQDASVQQPPAPPTLTATKDAFEVSTGDKIIAGQRLPKGTVIRYDVEVANGGGQSADHLHVSDPVPANCEKAPGYKGSAIDPATNGVAAGDFTEADGSFSSNELAAGSKVLVSFYCRTGEGFIDNTAIVTAENVSGRAAPSFGTIVSLSTNGVREESANAGGANGTAGPPGKAAHAAAAAVDPRISALEKLSRVEVSFERLGKGPCQWLNGSGGKFSKVAADKGKCDQPIWLRASGGRKWRYTLRKRLPRGHYLLLVRAVDVGGVSNNSFSARQHNLRNFTVR